MRTSERRLITILTVGAAFCFMSLALAWLFFGDTAVAQSIRLSRIRSYREFLERTLATDSRFQSIQVGVATSNRGGSVVLQGGVPIPGDLDALKDLIAETRPPAPVQYRVIVAPKP
jgi:hypothetical protein